MLRRDFGVEWIKIIGLSVASAIGYGVLHDQVTARVCLEYFTVGHPRILDSQDPTLIACAWGVRATWWVGLPLGGILAVASRAGSAPRLKARGLLLPLGILLGTMGLFSLASGLLGYSLARAGKIFLLPPLAERVPPDRHAAFLADLWAHSVSYLLGIVGGIALAIWVFIRRRRVLPEGMSLPDLGPRG